MKAAILAVAVLAMAGAAAHFGGEGSGPSHAAAVSGQPPAAHPALSPTSLVLPLFFEPNQGQTDGRVKFLAHGSGYGLFLTANEAVLSLQRAGVKGRPATGSVIRMKLDGASSAARIQGTRPLPGKSNYFIGNDPSKWRRGIPQFAGVEYQGVYPGIDLVYYGNQRQLEYDFRVAPGAEPEQIAFSFQGASARLESDDLVLSTAEGDVRFHAPRIYQLVEQPGANAERSIAGSFRQLAGNKIGFTVGAYDHSRELVIDPLLSYSTYLGGGGEVCLPPAPGQPPLTGQGCPQVAVDSANNTYVAGSTTSANFPVTSGAIQPTLGGPGAQNLFIATITTPIAPGTSQLLFATYLGGSGTDSLAGVAVDPGQGVAFPNINIYVAGTTTSTNFPTTSNAFEPSATFPNAPSQTHGFLSKVNVSQPSGTTSPTFTLTYSTYLAGNSVAGNGNQNGSDAVTGLAVDSSLNAYVTGTTTSTSVNTGFPSTPNGFQICPFQPASSGGTPCPLTSGPPQFFASQINTNGSGAGSMLYSTYYGGAYTNTPLSPVVTGGGIAVDPPTSSSSSTNVNMYFTGSTNMPHATSPNGLPGFPIYNAWQSCLDESGQTSCTLTSPTNPDAFVVKINPSLLQPNAPPVYATYLGGSENDAGVAVAVDTSADTYVTGATNSSDWLCNNSCTYGPYSTYTGTYPSTNAFVAEIVNESNIIFPLNFFTYIGGSGNASGQGDSGNAIAVDASAAAHVAGTTFSPNLPIAPIVANDYIQSYQGNGDAFVALISTILPNVMGQPPAGDYLTYLGGGGLDQGTGIALDLYGAAYVVGTTQSSQSSPPPFPTTSNAYQPQLSGTQNAFVTRLGAYSNVAISQTTGGPSPSPLPAGTQGTFTFNIGNSGPDPASNVLFEAEVPTSGLASLPTATVSSGEGSCSQQPLNGFILCTVGTLAVGGSAQVQVFMTPESPATCPAPPCTTGVTGFVAANGGAFPLTGGVGQTVEISDFSLTATGSGQTVQNGQLAIFSVALQSTTNLGYNATITMSQSSLPSIVTSPAPTFTINPVPLSGTTQAQTQLNIQTVARPVTTGSLFRRTSFYAAWLPIGGLSLVGLGIGAGRKRRRWLVGVVLGLIAGLVLLQPACSSSSSPTVTTGGTAAGQYTITITGAASTGASHNITVTLNVT